MNSSEQKHVSAVQKDFVPRDSQYWEVYASGLARPAGASAKRGRLNPLRDHLVKRIRLVASGEYPVNPEMYDFRSDVLNELFAAFKDNSGLAGKVAKTLGHLDIPVEKETRFLLEVGRQILNFDEGECLDGVDFILRVAKGSDPSMLEPTVRLLAGASVRYVPRLKPHKYAPAPITSAQAARRKAALALAGEKIVEFKSAMAIDEGWLRERGHYRGLEAELKDAVSLLSQALAPTVVTLVRDPRGPTVSL